MPGSNSPNNRKNTWSTRCWTLDNGLQTQWCPWPANFYATGKLNLGIIHIWKCLLWLTYHPNPSKLFLIGLQDVNHSVGISLFNGLDDFEYLWYYQQKIDGLDVCLNGWLGTESNATQRTFKLPIERPSYRRSAVNKMDSHSPMKLLCQKCSDFLPDKHPLYKIPQQPISGIVTRLVCSSLRKAITHYFFKRHGDL